MKITIRNLTVQFSGMKTPLFRLEKLDVASGKRVLIQGPSGRGKTSLLHVMAGLLSPASGSVCIDEFDLASLSDRELCHLRRESMGIIFQKLNLLSHLTARENVLLGAGFRSEALSIEEIKAETTIALEQVAMREQLDLWAQHLSLGQQQRVAVARVLFQKPKLVFADEPTSSLDDDNTEKVIRSIIGLPRTTTIVVVSHDHRIRDVFDQVYDFARLAGT